MEYRNDPNVAENATNDVVCDKVCTRKISSSIYYQSYTAAWDRRFDADKSVEAEAAAPIDEQYAPDFAVAPVAPAKKAPCYKRRLFPVIMMFILSVLAVAVAVLAIFKIEAIQQYVALSDVYPSVYSLFDCFSNGGSDLAGIFTYVLPIAAYLSLVCVLVALIMSIVAMANKKVDGFVWITLVAFLLWVLAAVSLYLAIGADTSFFTIGGAKAIGYGFIIIGGLELISFIFSFFAYKKVCCKK